MASFELPRRSGTAVSSGPTAGQVRRPSDGAIPREVVFIQCAGSRDPAKHLPYCSKICCMYTSKQAILYRHRVPEGQAYVFYIDIRAAGKGYDEFVQRAMEKERVIYLRGKVSRLYREERPERGGQPVVVVWGVDTLTARRGTDALAIAATESLAMAIIDPRLQDMNGATLGAMLRSKHNVPFLFLTQRSTQTYERAAMAWA